MVWLHRALQYILRNKLYYKLYNKRCNDTIIYGVAFMTGKTIFFFLK